MTKKKESDRALVSGFLNLYKPRGITSMEALRQVKRITGRQQKVGHCGTMDPLAHGVLPVCFGQATRLMDYVVGGTKRYLMEIRLGVTTTTYDAEGEVVSEKDLNDLSMQKVEETLESFVGLIDQTPPMYSAIKVQGQRLYKLARAGVQVDRKPRRVEIRSTQIVDYSPPTLTLDVESGKGAYMRSLAHDLGESLGCGGHVADLVRMSCGAFLAEEAVSLEQLTEAANSPSGWLGMLHPVDWVLKDLQSVAIGRQAEEYLRHGQSVSLGIPPRDAGYLELFRAYGADGQFLALVQLDRSANLWRPVKVFRAANP
jgi:tRNA pseudouridine55 synthase